MNNQPGLITYTDRRQVQQTASNDELNSFLNEMRIIDSGGLCSRISNIFVTSSMKRSNFCMDFGIREYATRGSSIRYMPVYGVKGGSPGLTRQTNYAEVLFCKGETLSGAGYNEKIFGTEYLTGEETVELSESDLLESLGREVGAPKVEVLKRDSQKVCKVLEKLWEVQEKEPRTRFVILMKDAEKNSMRLIQQLYLLMPQQLRRQLGFETNIAPADLEQIQAYGGVPLYVFTADVTERFDPSDYSFPISVYNLTADEEYSYNEERLALIGKLAAKMDDQMIAFLDFAERKYLETQQTTISSFKYYEGIVTNLLSGTLFWWLRENIESIEELEKVYMDQIELMQNIDYKRQALTAYSLDIYPNSSFASQMVYIICNEKYPNRKKLLEFLSRELLHEKEINAIDSMRKGMLSERTQAFQKKDDEYKQRFDSMTASFKEEKDSLNDQYSQLVLQRQSLEEKLIELSEENINLKKTLKENQYSSTEGNSKMSDTHSDRGSKKADTEKSEEMEKLKEQIRSTQLMRNIITVAAVACAVAAIVMSIMFINRGSKISQLQSKCNKLEEKERRVDGKNNELYDENEALRKDNESLNKKLAEIQVDQASPSNAESAGIQENNPDNNTAVKDPNMSLSDDEAPEESNLFPEGSEEGNGDVNGSEIA